MFADPLTLLADIERRIGRASERLDRLEAAARHPLPRPLAELRAAACAPLTEGTVAHSAAPRREGK